MICTLAVVTAAHMWIQGYNTLVTVCLYKCPSKRELERYVVDYGSVCPAQVEETALWTPLPLWQVQLQHSTQ